MCALIRPAALILMWLMAGGVSAGQRIVPLIPPGYSPSLDRDERGIWLELEEYEQQVAHSQLRLRDTLVNEYVERVACQVAGDYCQDIRVYVIRNPGFNASMAANGMMQVWTGLLLRTLSEDELASVLGHEVAHYAMGHTLARFRRLRSGTGIGSVFSLALGVVSGIYVPVGEMAALASALAFNREQESEADLLGAQLMDDAGFDPHASYAVWENLMAEEAVAVFRREEGFFFMRTHPDVEDRMVKLRIWVEETFGPEEGTEVSEQGLLALGSEYMSFMEDQVDTNRYGRTSYLLDRHAEIGIAPGMIEFFRGETYRQRGEEGDEDRAIEAYAAAIESDDTPAEAFRNSGYLLLKKHQRAAAKDMFRRYLEMAPDADDRAMIEFYLEE